MKNLAPVILFVYNRPVHTEKMLISLKENDLAVESKLYVYIDGPKPKMTKEALDKIEQVKKVVRSEQWCGEVNIVESNVNQELCNLLPIVLDEIFLKHEKAIVLEDDLILSKCFLKYMNEALDLYEDEERVMQVGGHLPPTNKKLPDTFFLKITTSWGWATWRRAWKYFNPSGKELLKGILQQDVNQFNFDGNTDMMYLLERSANGIKNHWDVRWYASVYLKGGYTLFPQKSVVRNIGHDGSGINCPENFMSDTYHTQSIASTINVEKIALIEENIGTRREVLKFYEKINNPGLLVRAKEKFAIIKKSFFIK